MHLKSGNNPMVFEVIEITRLRVKARMPQPYIYGTYQAHLVTDVYPTCGVIARVDTGDLVVMYDGALGFWAAYNVRDFKVISRAALCCQNFADYLSDFRGE